MELKDIKSIHLIGNQGVSMQGLAQVLQARGVDVSGCDLQVSGHDPKHITKDLDLVLYSSAVTPGSAGYLEVEKAKQLGVMTQKRAWLLGRLMQEKGKIGVAIAGIHGKSTTTAMVGAILVEAGEDPLVLGAQTRVGKGRYVVVEADEYDRSFHALVPKAAVVLNIEPEHLDYYTKGLPEIIRAFREFVKLVPANGVVVVNQDDKNAIAVAKSAKAKVKYFSVSKPPAPRSPNGEVGWPGFKLKVWGKHNLANATCAARLCHELGIDSKTIQKALNKFTGIKRRMEFKGQKNGVDLYDDYAHHPTEIKATLQAAREHFGKRRIIVVFQPHQYSRTKLLFDDFAKAFNDANQVLVAPIYRVAGRDEKIIPTLQGDLANTISHAEDLDLESIPSWLDRHTKPQDIVITMGAGPIDKVGEQWISQAGSKKS